MYHQLSQHRISPSKCHPRVLPSRFSTSPLWFCSYSVTFTPWGGSRVRSVVSLTIVASTPAGASFTLCSTNHVLARWSHLCCKRESTSCSAWRTVWSSIEGPLYAVSSFAICLILLLDTSGYESFDLLRRNCHRSLLGLYGSLVGVLVKERSLIGGFFFWHAFYDLCLKRVLLVLAGNTGLSCSWVVEKYAFWVKTREDVSPLPDIFLGASPCPRSTGMAKCVSIALSDIERDDTIVCILLHFWPTGSSGCLQLSQKTDSVVPCRILANAASLFSFL